MGKRWVNDERRIKIRLNIHRSVFNFAGLNVLGMDPQNWIGPQNMQANGWIWVYVGSILNYEYISLICIS